ncbi:hypothetical protein GH714_032534 [Hevea brasiliensis]|uniref:PDZ domain-containing protein n=1 Tax=Hevea brasiliensis TaxID=3981 RepID=A0A6A6M5E0_HEVBR|nr:hypothetical protein GH714_032534 [Hevea brasiliensis]
MEPLCSNFDLSPISTAPSKPALLPLFSSPRISTSIRLNVSRKWSLYCASSHHTAKTTVSRPQSNAQISSDQSEKVNTVQRTLVEAWGLIRETFVDPTFNHQANYGGNVSFEFSDAAYTKIKGMLSTLGDPFTRIISPNEYQSFRIGNDGNLQGVGIFINNEPKSGHLVVLSCVEGSPASRAGIHEGDELIEINALSLLTIITSLLLKARTKGLINFVVNEINIAIDLRLSLLVYR